MNNQRDIIVELSNGEVSSILNIPKGMRIHLYDYDEGEWKDMEKEEPYNVKGPDDVFQRDGNGDLYYHLIFDHEKDYY
jgi:hypothetical protein